jgi:hypothetical protein
MEPQWHVCVLALEKNDLTVFCCDIALPSNSERRHSILGGKRRWPPSPRLSKLTRVPNRVKMRTSMAVTVLQNGPTDFEDWLFCPAYLALFATLLRKEPSQPLHMRQASVAAHDE